MVNNSVCFGTCRQIVFAGQLYRPSPKTLSIYCSNSIPITTKTIPSFNPLRPNSDGSETSHCNIKGLSVSQVMRIENMITPVKFY